MERAKLTYERMEAEAHDAGLALPIEQTCAWARLEETIPGRAPWGAYRFERAGEPVAYLALFDYETHGYHYLRASHGPVWLGEPTAADESELLEALAHGVRAEDRKQVFVRLCVAANLPACRPTLSTVPYNQTVVMELEGGGEAILARMKKRGRRDVRKALRESPATYADETSVAAESFAEYYDVMLETAERDGFTPADAHTYESMIRTLGPEHCRVFAGRIDGRVVTWTIATVNDGHAVRYYGASRANVPQRNFVTDGLIFFEACAFSAEGVGTYDMMGIGNDFAPSLKGLNTFKTKFSQEVVDVAPNRDLPLRKVFYEGLVKARALIRR